MSGQKHSHLKTDRIEDHPVNEKTAFNKIMNLYLSEPEFLELKQLNNSNVPKHIVASKRSYMLLARGVLTYHTT